MSDTKHHTRNSFRMNSLAGTCHMGATKYDERCKEQPRANVGSLSGSRIIKSEKRQGNSDATTTESVLLDTHRISSLA